MIKMPEIGQEGVCVQDGAKALLPVLRSSSPNGIEAGVQYFV